MTDVYPRQEVTQAVEQGFLLGGEKIGVHVIESPGLSLIYTSVSPEPIEITRWHCAVPHTYPVALVMGIGLDVTVMYRLIHERSVEVAPFN